LSGDLLGVDRSRCLRQPLSHRFRPALLLLLLLLVDNDDDDVSLIYKQRNDVYLTLFVI